MNVCVIITAAGRSTRFGSDKLSADLGGRPMLIRTVEIFTKRTEVGSIIVAGPPDDFETFRHKYGPTLGFHGASLVEGGRAERWETVKNALAAVADDASHIAVHDAARPGVSKEVLDRVFEAARTMSAVIPGVPVSATMKRASDEAVDITVQDEEAIADVLLGDAGKVRVKARQVLETIDRRGLVEIQTPQVFDAALLKRAYAQKELSGATDDSSVVERLGETVYVVEGDARNIKVTTQADVSLMRAILGVKPPEQRPIHKQF